MFAGIRGFNDFAGSVSSVNGDLQVVRLPESNSNANRYTGFAVHYCPFGRVFALAVSSPRFNKFNGRVS